MCRYCPQFDALFEKLTVKEHLELYSRIKGLSESQVRAYPLRCAFADPPPPCLRVAARCADCEAASLSRFTDAVQVSSSWQSRVALVLGTG